MIYLNKEIKEVMSTCKIFFPKLKHPFRFRREEPPVRRTSKTRPATLEKQREIKLKGFPITRFWIQNVRSKQVPLVSHGNWCCHVSFFPIYIPSFTPNEVINQLHTVICRFFDVRIVNLSLIKYEIWFITLFTFHFFPWIKRDDYYDQ